MLSQPSRPQTYRGTNFRDVPVESAFSCHVYKDVFNLRTVTNLQLAAAKSNIWWVTITWKDLMSDTEARKADDKNIGFSGNYCCKEGYSGSETNGYGKAAVVISKRVIIYTQI